MARARGVNGWESSPLRLSNGRLLSVRHARLRRRRRHYFGVIALTVIGLVVFGGSAEAFERYRY
jgi:hypothetical protein